MPYNDPFLPNMNVQYDDPMAPQMPVAPPPTPGDKNEAPSKRRRFLMALAAGLSQQNQGGGFLGGLASGFAGSVMGGAAFDRQTHEDYRQREKEAAAAKRQAFRDQLDQSRMGIDQSRLGLEESRLGIDRERLGLERERLAQPTRDRAMTEIDFFRTDPAGYLKFKQTGREKPGDDRPKLGDLNTLSDNFRADKDVQNFTVVRDNYRRINSSAKLGTGQGDLATIFSFMRVLDPESVVRETEFKNASEAVGTLQRIYNVPKKWVQGDRLTPEGRAGFVRAARDLYETQKKTYETKSGLYRRQAKSYGVDPTLIIPDYKDDEFDPEAARAKYGY